MLLAGARRSGRPTDKRDCLTANGAFASLRGEGLTLAGWRLGWGERPQDLECKRGAVCTGLCGIIAAQTQKLRRATSSHVDWSSRGGRTDVGRQINGQERSRALLQLLLFPSVFFFGFLPSLSCGTRETGPQRVGRGEAQKETKAAARRPSRLLAAVQPADGRDGRADEDSGGRASRRAGGGVPAHPYLCASLPSPAAAAWPLFLARGPLGGELQPSCV